MKTIKLEIPNDDAIALRYIGEALVNMAGQYGTKKLNDDLKEAVVKAERVIGIDRLIEDIKSNPVERYEDETDASVIERVKERFIIDTNAPNLPWDERIHSGNKTQNVDGSWKKRKKPKDMTTEQWNEFIEQVETELTTLMSIPVESPSNEYPLYWRHDGSDEVGIIRNDEEFSFIMTPDTVLISEELFNELRVNTTETDFEDEPEVVDRLGHTSETIEELFNGKQPDITPPPPPVEIVPKPQDAVTPPPPPVVNDAPVGITQEGVKAVKFVELVKMLSVRCAGDVTKSTKIKEAIKAKYDVEFTALSKRPDLIPQVAEFLNTIEV